MINRARLQALLMIAAASAGAAAVASPNETPMSIKNPKEPPTPKVSYEKLRGHRSKGLSPKMQRKGWKP